MTFYFLSKAVESEPQPMSINRQLPKEFDQQTQVLLEQIADTRCRLLASRKHAVDMWLTLPIEIQRKCLEAVDVPTLKSFRLSNKYLSTLAAEILFRTINLHPNEESAEKFKNIVEDQNLRPLIRTIILNTSDISDKESNEEANLCPSFKQCLKSIARFETLREVRLNFSIACAGESVTWGWNKEVAETIWFRTEVLRKTFKPLARAIPEGCLSYFDTLTILNLQDHVDAEIYESEDFSTVLGKVKKLHLRITTETDEGNPENNNKKPGCLKMFNHDLITNWLLPTSDQLTHLSLYTTQLYWGFLPFCDMRRTHFPRLRSLSLGNYTIAHEWQIDWILSHAETLEELILDDCPIINVAILNASALAPHWPNLKPHYTHPETHTTTYIKEIDLWWHYVFSRFRTGLPKLCHFAIGWGAWDEMRMFEERHDLVPQLIRDRYCIFDYAIGPSPWIGGGSGFINTSDDLSKRFYETFTGLEKERFWYPSCDAEDRDALAALLEVTRARGEMKA